MAIQTRDTITPREQFEMQYNREILELQMAHAKEMKELEIEVAKLEARFSSWLRLPVLIIKLPVLLVFAVGYCIDRIKGNEPSPDFWRLIT